MSSGSRPRSLRDAVMQPARGLSRSAVLVLVVGLALTGLLSWISYVQHARTEQRLLELQTRVAGSLLQVVEPSIETPLTAAARIGSSNGGDPASFRSYVNGYIKKPTQTKSPNPFVTAQLWRVDSSGTRLLGSAGQPTALSSTSGYQSSVLARAAHGSGLLITDPLAENTAQPRLGYAVAHRTRSAAYVVYAESMLPPHRRAPVSPTSPFGDLRVALYLGNSAKHSMLIEANAALPLATPTASVLVPFGTLDATTNHLFLVASSPANLSGWLSGSLWWLVAVAGVLVTLFAALAAQRLVARRRRAERLAHEVNQLLGEQRSIAETLQRALLPQALPQLLGLDASARYLPGVSGVEIGGDWYDLIPLPENRFFFAVGDVSGRGVEAGAVMASLQFAIRAFVSEAYPPDKVLNRLARLIALERDGHFATVLVGLGDIDRREVTFANAGHPPPVLVADDAGVPVRTAVGPPIGVTTTATYEATTIRIPQGATLLAYTDGLIERRDEDLADSMRRLQRAASRPSADLDELLDGLVEAFAQQALDDTALIGLRWRG